MNTKESRELPIEIRTKFIEFLNLKDCKETAIKYSLFEGRALSFARKSNALWDEIKKDINEIYPDLIDKNWYMQNNGGEISLLIGEK